MSRPVAPLRLAAILGMSLGMSLGMGGLGASWLGASAPGATALAAPGDGVQFDEVKDPLAASTGFLPVDKAFVFSARLDDDLVVARWDMPDGYYLYRQKFKVDHGHGVRLGEMAIPTGERRIDEYFGESEVYFGSVEIGTAILERTERTVTVQFGYQGCAERGLCYPPATKSATFEFAGVPASPGASTFAWAALAALVLILAATLAVVANRQKLR